MFPSQAEIVLSMTNMLEAVSAYKQRTGGGLQQSVAAFALIGITVTIPKVKNQSKASPC